MPKLKPTQIKITKKQKEILKKYAQKRTAKAHYKERIKIVLLASAGEGNNKIAKQLNIVNTTVRKWRNRWALYFNKLTCSDVNGDNLSNNKILEKMLNILSDAQRQGKPSKITEAQKKEITAMACQKPEDYNLPFTNWTHKILAKTAVKEKILKKISPCYVGLILKKTNCSRINQNTGFIRI